MKLFVMFEKPGFVFPGMFLLLFPGVFSFAQDDVDVFADVLLRYESETSHIAIADRERLRLVAHLGARYQLSDRWKVTGRLSTGLKNRQNVPAITIHKFNEQPTPDSDIYIDQLFVSGKVDKLNIKVGKIPWSTWQVTDVYWDRQLHPIGIHLDYNLNQQHRFSHMSALPLDGNSGTIGQLHVSQWHYRFKYHDWNISIAPWLMVYKGQDQAEFATRDTQRNNQLMNLSMQAQYGNWTLGMDLGRSLEDFSDAEFGEFADEKNSRVVQLKYGNLKAPGNIQAHLRYVHLERFSAITEFASNATQRFGTSNVAGWDLLVRRKMAKHWWLGARFAHMATLEGTPETGNRFRIEAKYAF